jgi:Sec-independent protein translocase protein TatA
VGFGVEIVFFVMLGLLILGPKGLHSMLVRVARAKVELERATRGLKSELATVLEVGETDGSRESVRPSPAAESAPDLHAREHNSQEHHAREHNGPENDGRERTEEVFTPG